MGALKGIELIKNERIRQIAEEGYSIEDDRGRALELHRAGIAYLQYSLLQIALVGRGSLDDVDHPSDVDWIDGEPLWPWDRDDWKPGTVLENSIKGAALIAAGLDWAEELAEAGVE